MEADIIRAIQTIASPAADAVFQGITMLGEETLLIALLGVLYWAVDKRLGLFAGSTLLVSLACNNLVKDLVRAERPIGTEGIRTLRAETATGWSFPSGHTQGAASFYGAAAWWTRRKSLIAGAVALSLAVALSRLYLGVHWPRDVLAGLGFALAFIALNHLLFTRLRNHALAYGIVFLVFLPGILLDPSPDYVKALGSFAGFVAGLAVEGRFIGFATEGKAWKRALRAAIGLALLFALKFGLKAVMPDALPADFARYALLTFAGVGLVPFLFKPLRI